jgi:tetratricopeptide (TPR) repeat protein
VDTLAKYVKLGSILLDRFQESKYSKDDELQADRVGLYLAATAGYDTRQAPSIWRAKYADNFREVAKDKDFLLDVVEAAGKDKSGLERESVPNKEEAAIGFGIDAAKVALQEKWNEWWKKSGETHPEERERFERLYFYISLNDYSDASKKYITNEQLWMQKRGEYAGDLLKEQWKIAFGTAKTPEQRLELLKLPLAKGWEPKVVYMQLRALTYTEMGMWKEALADYELLRKIEPDNAAFVSAWARCKIEQGKSAEVLAELAKWIAKQPDNDALLYRRAEAFFKLQRYTDAVKDLTKALEIDTDNTAYLFLRGMCFYRLKKWPAAADDFESILMIDPDNAEAANNLELIRQEQEKAKGEKSK